MNTFIKNFKTELILIVVTSLVLIITLSLNDINIHIRLKELKVNLQKSNYDENNLDHIYLIMKYNLHSKMYENQYSDEKADQIEMKVNKLINHRPSFQEIKIEGRSFLNTPVLFFINTFRKITGKLPISDIDEDDSIIDLDIAYYFERNKYYTKALETYDTALEKTNLNKSYIAGIFLHQGFCNAILGNYDKAKELYKKILNDFSDQKVAITAAILLNYLEGFHTEYKKVLSQEINSAVKSEKLFKLLAYKESIRVLEKIEKNLTRDQISKMLYYKGRCFEELGQKEKSINSYLKVVINNTNQRFSMLANRRIYMIGLHIRENDNILGTATEINEMLKDKVLSDYIEKNHKLPQKKDANTSKYKKILSHNYSLISPDSKILLDRSLKEKLNILLKNNIQKKTSILKSVKVKTIDGNIFVGEIIKKTDSAIFIKTTFGSNIKIKNSKIESIEY